MIDLLPILVPFAAVGLAIIGIYIDRSRISEVGNYLVAKRRRESVDARQVRAVPLQPTVMEPITIKDITPEQTTEAIDNLISYARTLSINWIFGVHTSGRLLSVLLASRLGIPPQRCLYVGTRFGRHKGISIDRLPNVPLEGNVLVVDDISRSGATLSSIRQYLVKRRYEGSLSFDRLYLAVLATVVADDTDSRQMVNWTQFLSSNYYLKFPWTEFSSRSSAAFENDQLGFDADQTMLAKFARIRDDFSSALAVMNELLGIKLLQRHG